MIKSSFENYFVNQLISFEILTEGNFVLSSNQRSSFYYDFNKFHTGSALDKLGFSFYKTACEYFPAPDRLTMPFDVVYGCAYKGITIAMAVSTHAWHFGSVSIPWTFNRKEIKDHGDLSWLIGYSDLRDKNILVVDDVVTTGKSLEKNIEFLLSYNPKKIYVLAGVSRNDTPIETIGDVQVTYITTHEKVLKRKEHLLTIGGPII